MSEMMLTAKQQKVVVKLSDLQAQTDQLNRLIQTETDPIKQRKMAKKITKLRDRMEHLRVHIILPEQRTRADRLYLRLKTFHILIVLCMIVILFLTAVCIITAHQRQKATYLADYYRNEVINLSNQVQELSGMNDAQETPVLTPTETPNPMPTEAPDPTPTETPEQEHNQEASLYYVQTVQNGTRIQIGAFGVLENAKKLADENRHNGYKVYDEYGNCVYDPDPSATSIHQQGTSLYYVRKTEGNKYIQIGAFGVLENAKKTADENRHNGYKVYDEYGNCIYDPS